MGHPHTALGATMGRTRTNSITLTLGVDLLVTAWLGLLLTHGGIHLPSDPDPTTVLLCLLLGRLRQPSTSAVRRTGEKTKRRKFPLRRKSFPNGAVRPAGG